jgi:hypothetical protein
MTEERQVRDAATQMTQKGIGYWLLPWPSRLLALAVGLLAGALLLGRFACGVDWKLLLEYVKVAASWPPVILALVVVFTAKFQQNVARLIDRIKHAKGYGVEFDASHAQQVNPDALPNPPVSNVAAPQRTTTAVAPLTGLSAGLQSGAVGASAGGHPTPTSTQMPIDAVSSNPESAKREILKWWSIAKFESVMNLIFGTQYRLMLHLYNVPVTGETLDNARLFYIEHTRLATSTPIPEANFFSYLVHPGFLRMDGNRCFITEFGKQFVEHIEKTYGQVARVIRGL